MQKKPTAAVILGAGRGTRLKGVARPFSKTIVSVNDLPVIGYAVRAVEPYVDKIILVAHPDTAEAVLEAVTISLKNRHLSITVALQDIPRGMADAMRIGFSALEEDHSVVVIAGDNIVLDERNVKNTLDKIMGSVTEPHQYKLAWTYQELIPEEARRFSVYMDLGEGRGKLIEKPEIPPSRICWCGPVAFFSSDDAYRRVQRLTPSSRGEYEATDLMNSYLMNGESIHIKLRGRWFDIGTPESLAEARMAIATINF
jgi:glucose-1-phosphate thymidylyltransferase